MHFRKTASNASAVATNIDASVTAAMWHAVSSTASVTRLDVTPLDNITATLNFPVTGAKWTGGTGADFVPQVAGLVSLRTSLRGPEHRGRVYLPFIAEADVTNGSFISAEVTAGQAAWSTFVTAVAAAGSTLVVASYVLQTAANVTSALFETQLATQRRRQSRLRV